MIMSKTCICKCDCVLESMYVNMYIYGCVCIYEYVYTCISIGGIVHICVYIYDGCIYMYCIYLLECVCGCLIMYIYMFLCPNTYGL